MTKPDALDLATTQAAALNTPFDVWEHVGFGPVIAQHRFIARSSQAPPPSKVWVKRETVPPEGLPAADAPVVALAEMPADVQAAMTLASDWLAANDRLPEATALQAVLVAHATPAVIDAVQTDPPMRPPNG